MTFGAIGIENLKVVCFIGVYPHEKISKQELLLDLKIKTDLSKCIKSDSLEDAVDYDGLAALCASLANLKHYHLIETLAQAIIEGIFQKFAVEEVWIRIKKLQGLPGAECAFVELLKRRGD